MIGALLSPFERFMCEWAVRGTMGPFRIAHETDVEEEFSEDRETVFTTAEVVECFRGWLATQTSQDRARADMSSSALGLKLREMFPEVPSAATGHARTKARTFPPRPEVQAMLQRHSNRGYAGLIAQMEMAEGG